MRLRHLARAFIERIVLNPVTLLCVAMLSGLVGGVLLYDAPAYAARAARAERLQSVSAASLTDSAPGREVLLEGQVSARTPAVYRAFVAYVREEYRSRFMLGGDSQHWEEAERVTPPLVVALPDGEARIANDNYLFDTTAFTMREAEPTLTKGAIQSRGYRAGDPALAVGTVVVDGGERAVAAEFLYAGSRAAYIAEMRRLARQSLPIGGALLLICVVSTAGLVWQVRRFLREVAAEQAAVAAMPAPQAARKRPRQRAKSARRLK
jgi:hypothetical protein